ncbi:hypothetical protein BU26DRAFT_189752 [Trematosphaeria pertusa]|uniref:Uncharacterized protein n=1 Tax=Trematosphaeria pertusa TaxID=390896 RepID=A0A6A6HS06_9PLEO|nr:uncharacterized protein BU26DRAFT_189752 [Trematosphaeria pertusa]KAF2240781.1 hypothetical protein BU26DRAFT_189752 [Trematosphaeria pertusa]
MGPSAKASMSVHIISANRTERQAPCDQFEEVTRVCVPSKARKAYTVLLETYRNKHLNDVQHVFRTYFQKHHQPSACCWPAHARSPLLSSERMSTVTREARKLACLARRRQSSLYNDAQRRSPRKTTSIMTFKRSGYTFHSRPASIRRRPC